MQQYTESSGSTIPGGPLHARHDDIPRSAASLSSPSTLWIPPDAVAQIWGQLGAEATTASIFFVCALAFQGLASEASALHHYNRAYKAKGHANLARRHLLLHTARELTDACRSWDAIVGWLSGSRRRDLPLSEAVLTSLVTGAREQVARLWGLQGQVHTELVQVCLRTGLLLPCPTATSFVPSSLSTAPPALAADEEPVASPDVVVADGNAAQQEAPLARRAAQQPARSVPAGPHPASPAAPRSSTPPVPTQQQGKERAP